MTADLFLRDALLDGQRQDLSIVGGRVAATGPDLSVPPEVPVLDAAGALVLPGLVDAHNHPDKTLLGMGWHPHGAGPELHQRIAYERENRAAIGLDPRRQSARFMAHVLRHGTTAMRGHVDIDTQIGLAHIEGVLQTRADWADRIDVQIVAFPQSGLIARPGTLALMDAALRAGADVVGGLDPCSMDRDPLAHLDAVFGLAETHGRPVDIHLHEPGEMGAFSLELIAERTAALGMAGRVSVSHAFCLNDVPEARFHGLVAALARAGVAIATAALVVRPSPPARALQAAGVTLCGGNDGVRDMWLPFGSGDMLERAKFIALANGFRTDPDLLHALEICTAQGARALNLPEHGTRPGQWADLVLVPAQTPAEAVVAHPPGRTVIKRGRIVSTAPPIPTETA
ncbi:MAG: amidohydrolase family protein [Rhodobacteraceae bacterium]|nr:amidohydrolase family protein [Paracoccaceae bacterium]